MAIIQISRIQHRSGLYENLPQLAKAELGWAVDDRRLFIGNGQLSDRAPETGNTEILTEYSDILNLANSYTFKNTDAGYTPQTGNAKSQYNAIAWDGISQYVSVGADGRILHSVDGVSWLNTDSGTVNDLLGVAYGNGKFVAVGANGTIIYSVNGSSWQNSNAVAYTAVNGITYDVTNSLFVIVTLIGTIYTSTNGIDWTLRNTSTVTTANITINTNTIIVTTNANIVIGQPVSGLGIPPGTTVTKISGTTITISNNATISGSGVSVTFGVGSSLGLPLNAVTYGNGIYVAVGANGVVLKSTDAKTWTTQSISAKDIYSVNYLNGNFIVTTSGNKSFYSVNKVISTTATTVVSTNTISVASASGISIGQIVTGTGIAVGTIVTNISGTTITLSNNATVSGTGVSVSFTDLLWYRALVDTFTGTSADASHIFGITSWGDVYNNRVVSNTMTYLTTIGSGIENFTYFYYANNLYIALTGSGRIFTSSDASVWVERSSGVSTGLNSVNYNGSMWVVVGDSGVILTSTDGTTFTSRTSNTSSNLLDVINVSATTWIAVGTDGSIVTSPNGTTWTFRYSGVSQDLRGVTVADLGGGSYQAFAVGRGGIRIQSSGSSTTTGTTWSVPVGINTVDPANQTANVYDLNKIIYQTFTPPGGSLRNRYIAVGDRGRVLTSADGINWFTKTTYTDSDFQTVIYSNSYFFVLGDVGLTYLNSTDSDTWSENSEFYGQNLAAPDIRGFATDGSFNVMGGQYGFLYTSNNQIKYWHTYNLNGQPPINYSIYSLLYSTKFVAAGANGLIAYSTDKINWTQQSYSYGASSTVRSIQSKLDDFVSVKDFGARGDGVTDDTEAINRALYEVFCRNLNPSARKVLYFPGGNYLIYGSIDVPSNARIRGEGKYNTIITQTISPYVYPYITWVMQTADNKQQTGTLIGLNGASTPTDIVISDIGLQSLGDGFLLNSATQVTLNNVRFTGPFSNVTSSTDPISGNSTIAIKISGYSLVPPDDINIIDCMFSGFNYGISLISNQYLTNMLVDSCTFSNMFNGILLNGTSARNVTISNSTMDKIYAEGVKTSNCTNILSFGNYYKDVGNHLAGYASPVTNVIGYDSTSIGCASIGDTFDRTDTYNIVVHRVTETVTNIDWNYTAGLRLGAMQQMMGKSVTLAASTTAALLSGFDDISNSDTVGLEMLYTVSRNSAVRTGILKVSFLNNVAYFDDDSTQTGDVGITFGYSGSDLTYTSDSNGTGTLNYAIRYLEML
jgi:hypothetical protein